MTDQLEVQMIEKESEKENLINEMAQIKRNILEEMESFASEWFLITAKKEVSNYPKRVYDLGTERLKELKQEVMQLSGNTAELVEQYLNIEKIWWHEKENKGSYYAYDNRLMDDLDKQIKSLFGELGKLLSKYEIANVMINGSFEQGSWVNEFETVRYAYSIKYPEEIYQLNKKYVDLINNGQKLNEELEQLNLEKEKAKIGELWDSL